MLLGLLVVHGLLGQREEAAGWRRGRREEGKARGGGRKDTRPVKGAGGDEGLVYLEMKGEGGEGKGVTSVDAKADCGMDISFRPSVPPSLTLTCMKAHRSPAAQTLWLK